MNDQISADAETAMGGGTIECASTEQMLSEVEDRIIEQLDALRRTVIERKSEDTASCEAAFLKILVSRRNTLLRMHRGRLKL